MVLIFNIFASQVNFFREGTVGDHQPVRDVSKYKDLTQITYGRVKVESTEYNTTEVVYVS